MSMAWRFNGVGAQCSWIKPIYIGVWIVEIVSFLLDIVYVIYQKLRCCFNYNYCFCVVYVNMNKGWAISRKDSDLGHCKDLHLLSLICKTKVAHGFWAQQFWSDKIRTLYCPFILCLLNLIMINDSTLCLGLIFGI